MKTTICLSLALLLGISIFAMDDLKIAKKNQIVKFNMGGYKADTTLQSIYNSGSEYLNALFSGKFAQTKDSDGRIFIDCSQPIAQAMHHYMCHCALNEGINLKIVADAADFFACDGLKALVEQKESDWKWLKLNTQKYEACFLVDNKWVSTCPVCHQLINYQTSRYDSDIDNILAHLIISHKAQRF
jgi:hypothetical protein